MPPSAHGLSVDAFVAGAPRLTDLWPPLLVLDDAVLDADIPFVAGSVAERGLELMPHGKTTMAPQLWKRQLDAGATGITVATPWQLGVAVDAGIPSIMLANPLTDPGALRWLASGGAGAARVWSWVDDADAVSWIEQSAGAIDEPLEVLVELGRPGGRTGARSLDEAMRIAERVATSPALRLAGVAGYEGAIAKGRDDLALDTAHRFVDDLVVLHHRLRDLYDGGDVIVTAGGSAFPDVVADVCAAAAADAEARFVLRSGAYITHDDGYYRSVSPFEGHGLRAAARGVARVVSHPEPGLVLVDAGKRDFPYDEGLPVPLFALARDGGRLELGGASVAKLNDQHAFVRLEADAGIRLGDLIVFGLSHPCTMFDKWRLIPVVDSLDDPRASIVRDLVETRF
jgi:D-serine deaminase-like pyridoxal phosphate-dependent protein